MAKRDSVDKLVGSYFAVFTRRDFTYKGKQYIAKPLRVSPDIVRGFTCPAKCGACCPVFSLDYLPTETRPADSWEHEARLVSFNNQNVLLHTDWQDDNTDSHCKNVRKDDGRCSIHGRHPFSCDFELIRSAVQQSDTRPNQVTTRLYGRGWNMLKVDGERGAQCTIVPPSAESIEDTVRKLSRLNTWMWHFGLQENHCAAIIDWIREGDFSGPLLLNP